MVIIWSYWCDGHPRVMWTCLLSGSSLAGSTSTSSALGYGAACIAWLQGVQDRLWLSSQCFIPYVRCLLLAIQLIVVACDAVNVDVVLLDYWITAVGCRLCPCCWSLEPLSIVLHCCFRHWLSNRNHEIIGSRMQRPFRLNRNESWITHIVRMSLSLWLLIPYDHPKSIYSHESALSHFNHQPSITSINLP